MNFNLMEEIGLAGLDLSFVFIGLCAMLLILLVWLIIQTVQLAKLKKKYAKFMSGKNAKSLEKDIIALFEDNKFIKSESEKNRKDIRNILKKLEFCYQKAGLVKYDAYNQMGGNLSFCLCMLNERNSGFILNSVHSSDGCYTYTKEIKNGECEIALGEEERKALNMAIGF